MTFSMEVEPLVEMLPVRAASAGVVSAAEAGAEDVSAGAVDVCAGATVLPALCEAELPCELQPVIADAASRVVRPSAISFFFIIFPPIICFLFFSCSYKSTINFQGKDCYRGCVKSA